MITVDHRLIWGVDKIYRMVGSCSNCGTKNILILYSVGQKIDDIDCPVCGCYHTIIRLSQRKATESEIPVA